jgi:hypothetical protein
VYKLNWEWNTTTYGAQTGTTSVKYSQTSTNATNTTPLSTSSWGKSEDISGNEEIDYSMYIAPLNNLSTAAHIKYFFLDNHIFL